MRKQIEMFEINDVEDANSYKDEFIAFTSNKNLIY